LKKNEENHGVQFTAQSALKKSPIYRISVTNYQNSHAAILSTELKYYQTKAFSERRALIAV